MNHFSNILRATACLVFTCCVMHSHGQKAKAQVFHVIVNEPEYTRDFNVIDKEKTLLVRSNRDYHWYKSNRVLTTKGGQGGRLLHGDYSEYYLNKNLKSQGHIRKGTYVGTWKEWWPNGMIKARYRYRFGKKAGKQYNYDQDGTLTSIVRYRQGKRWGWTVIYQDGDRVKKERYRKGDMTESRSLEVDQKAEEKNEDNTSTEKAQTKRARLRSKKPQAEPLEPLKEHSESPDNEEAGETDNQ